jgi:hypothetical protein
MSATSVLIFDPVYKSDEAEICNKALARIGADRIRDTTESTKQANACRAVYAATRDELLRMFPWNFAIRSDLILQDMDYAYALKDGEYAFIADGRRTIASAASSTPFTTIPTITDPATLEGDWVGRRVTGTAVVAGTTITAINDTTKALTLDRATGALGVTQATMDVITAGAGSAFISFIPLLKILSINDDPDAQYSTAGGDSEKRILTSVASGVTVIDSEDVYYLSMRYIRQVLNPDQFDPIFVDALVLRIASKVASAMTRSASTIAQIQSEFSAVMQQAKTMASEERQVDEASSWWTDRKVGAGPTTHGRMS